MLGKKAKSTTRKKRSLSLLEMHLDFQLDGFFDVDLMTKVIYE